MAKAMKVDPELCISCGACIDTSPAVFDWDDNEKAVAIVDQIPENVEGDAIAAQEGCPTDAIKDA
ncbi:ferredoxin [Selenihalanaerobacter shriftii]|uniref:Ferredoxin n=1 Tax=Selenihalanaerobacter shriftii TaxID=142842 RepID=A0A1T4QG20_9FIRM|nr:ferredoxin [Selenihalanaerobacter shriftii]SKA02586.1 ferredoxin [Selenihalanaerobacter shriftii]